MRLRNALLSMVLCLALVACAAPFPAPTQEQGSPQPWRPGDWDITVHSRDRETWKTLEPMSAHHGNDCAAAPAAHQTDTYEQAVFTCRNHVMTAINASGYGMIYLTPNRLVDFSEESGGTARILFDLSTLRSSLRDWVDVWITPYDHNLQLPLDHWLPDGNGEPRWAVHIRMDAFLPQNGPAQTVFKASIVRDHVIQEVQGNWWTGYESLLTPSPTRRDTFELQLSRTHIKFGMPEHNFWWVDSDITDLGWEMGVVQLGHHSYHPTKDCKHARLAPHLGQLKVGHEGCAPNTWHWNNIIIHPSKPFTIIPANMRAIGPRPEASATRSQDSVPARDQGGLAEVRFPRSAPADSHLRFAAIGEDVEISLDGGMSWMPALRQEQRETRAGIFQSYWTPVPVGTQQVLVRGGPWYGGEWHARDFSIWSLKLSKSEASAGVMAGRYLLTTLALMCLAMGLSQWHRRRSISA